ncbi:MAG: hypothetical protein AAF587_28570 [Bacteroidota bacterium]
MLRFAVCALLFALLPTSAFNMFDPASEKAKIRSICEQQVESWRMRDFQGESDVWAHESYIMKMLTNGTRTFTWETIGGQYAADFKDSASDYEPDFFTELSDFYIHINGKNAWVVFDQHQVFPDEVGKNQLYESLEVRFLEKIEGEWKIVFQLTGPYDSPTANSSETETISTRSQN